jgi:hypothetical protein
MDHLVLWIAVFDPFAWLLATNHSQSSEDI